MCDSQNSKEQCNCIVDRAYRLLRFCFAYAIALPVLILYGLTFVLIALSSTSWSLFWKINGCLCKWKDKIFAIIDDVLG